MTFPAWAAVVLPFAAFMAAVAATNAVIESGLTDAVCVGAARPYLASHVAAAVEAVWCDLRGAGWTALDTVR